MSEWLAEPLPRLGGQNSLTSHVRVKKGNAFFFQAEENRAQRGENGTPCWRFAGVYDLCWVVPHSQ